MFKKSLMVGFFFTIMSTNVCADLISANSSKFSSEVTRDYDNFSPESKLEAKKLFSTTGWIEVTKSDGKSYRVDANHIRNTSSSMIQGWVKTIIVEDIIQDGFALNDYTMTQIEIDCDSQKFRILSTTNYQKSKKSETVNAPPYSGMISIIPDSLGYEFMMPMCDMNYIMTH